jgi:heptosyltransferase-2
VAVFGPTDYRATGPVSDKWLIVYDKEPCAPCFKRVCPSGDRSCMKKIQASEVIDALKMLNVI